MNKSFYRLLLHASVLLSCLVVCTACPGPHPDEPDYVEVSVKTLEFPWQSGSSKSIAINANTDWEIEGLGSIVAWLRADPSFGKSGVTSVRLQTTQDNESVTERTATLIITAGDDSKTITVTQAAQPITYHLNVYPQVLGFGFQEAEEHFTVDTNDEWTVACSAGWCAVQKDGNGSALVTVERNTTQQVREATITVTGTKSRMTATVEVTQKGTSIFDAYPFDPDKDIDDYVPWRFDVTPTELTFDCEGATQSISISGNDDWTATSSQPTWCKLSAQGGSSETAIEVTVERNNDMAQRKAVIIVTGTHTGKAIEVNVMQRGNSEFERDEYGEDTDIDLHYEFMVDPTALVFLADGETKPLAISGNDEWEAVSNDVSWCSLSESKGHGPATIYVTAKSNESPTVRSTTITLKGKLTGQTFTVYVTQEGNGYSFDATPTELIFSATGGSKIVNISGNDEWTATSDATNWCTVSKGSGTGAETLSVTVTKYGAINRRSATIELKGKYTGKTITVNVTQKGINDIDREEYDDDQNLDMEFTFGVSTTALSFEAQGGTKNIVVTGNDEWTATSDATYWCTVSKASGTGAETLSVTATRNGNTTQRTAKVTLKGKQTGRTVTVNVTQKGINDIDREEYDDDQNLDMEFTFDVSPTALSFEAQGGTKSIVVTGNDEWTATSDATYWCTVSKTSGTGAGTLNVTATRNGNTTQRTAKVTLKGKQTGRTVTVNVTQKGISDIDREEYDDDQNLDLEFSFDASPTALSFETQGGTKSIVITGNDEWTATSDATYWCTVSKASGTGAGTLNVTATRNNNTTQRTAKVTLIGKQTGKTVTVNVTQKGSNDFGREGYDNDKDLDEQYTLGVSPATLIFEAQGETKAFSINGNDDWTVSAYGSWCTVSRTSGTGEAIVSVTTTKNTSGKQRTTTIIVTGKHTGKTFTVSITQKGSSGFDHDGYDPDKDLDEHYTFNVTPTTLTLEGQGETKTFSISGNDDWTTTSANTSWCIVSKASGTGQATVSVTATKNTSASQRTTIVTVRGSHTGKTFTVSITQKGNSGFDRDGYGPNKDLDN